MVFVTISYLTSYYEPSFCSAIFVIFYLCSVYKLNIAINEKDNFELDSFSVAIYFGSAQWKREACRFIDIEQVEKKSHYKGPLQIIFIHGHFLTDKLWTINIFCAEILNSFHWTALKAA